MEDDAWVRVIAVKIRIVLDLLQYNILNILLAFGGAIDTETDSAVPSCLPRNVRVQPNEVRVVYESYLQL